MQRCKCFIRLRYEGDLGAPFVCCMCCICIETEASSVRENPWEEGVSLHAKIHTLA